MQQDGLWEFHQTTLPGSFFGSEARLESLARLIAPGEAVLNIGIGGGIFEEIALRLGIDVYSVDPSQKTVELLRKRLGLGDKVQQGRGERLPFPDQKFSAVVVSEVLEHLSDDVLEATLREIHRVLVSGGRLIGTVPSREDLNKQLVVCPSCGAHFHRWGHVRSFDEATLSRLLEHLFCGVKVKERLFITWKILNWKGKIAAFAKRLLFELGVHGQDESLMFVAYKPRDRT